MVRLCNLQLCVYLCEYMMCLAERKTDQVGGRFNQNREMTALSSQSPGIRPPYLCPRILLSPLASSYAGWGMEFSPNRNPVWARKPKLIKTVGRKERDREGKAEACGSLSASPRTTPPQPAPQSALRMSGELTIPTSTPRGWSLPHLSLSSRQRAFLLHTPLLKFKSINTN